jgi:hypothetical protein
MFYRIRYFLKIEILLFLTLNRISVPAQNNTDADSKIILAKVAGREITLEDFYSRAEYTIRPQYCKGNTNIDKKIILNSLIAEKILALQSEPLFNLMDDERIYNMITGLKEQKMRALLSYYEGDSKVKLDTNELKKYIPLPGGLIELNILIFRMQSQQSPFIKNSQEEIHLFIRFLKQVMMLIQFTKEK